MAATLFQFKASNRPEAKGSLPLSMTFPALVQRQYGIISDEENGYILSEVCEGSNVVALVEVDRDVTLKVNVPADGIVKVKVNDRDLEKSSVTLKPGATVQIGDSTYTFVQLPSEIANVRKLMQDFLPCPVCKQVCKDPRLLRCGHSFCAACLTQKIRNAMSSTPKSDVQLPAGVAAAAERDEILQQMRTVTCPVCSARVSCWEATKAYKPLALNQTFSVLGRWMPTGKDQPQCSVCLDSRCIVDLKDYEFCETCDRILCPVCAVEGHIDHDLRPREAIVKTMHENGKMIAIKKAKAFKLRQDEIALKTKAVAAMEEFKRLETLMKKIMSDEVTKCATIVSQLEEEAHPIVDSSAQIFDRFRVQMEKSTKSITRVSAAADRLTRGLEEMTSSVADANANDNAK